jgi:hypothetical protein
MWVIFARIVIIKSDKCLFWRFRTRLRTHQTLKKTF